MFIIEIWVKLTCAKIGREKVLTLKSGSVLAAPITNPGSNFLPISIVWFGLRVRRHSV